MSIILDALKKAEKEKNKNQAEGETPPSLDSLPLQETKSASSFGGLDKKRLQLIAIGVLSIVLLGLFLFSNSSTKLPFAKQAQNKPVVKQPANTTPAKPQQPEVASATVATQTTMTTTTITPPTTPLFKSASEEQTLRAQALQSLKEGNIQDSLAAYEKLLIINSVDPEVYNNYGVALRRAGETEKARAAYTQALALNPDYPQALNNMAIIYMSDGKYMMARDLLKRAIELDPAYVDAYLHLGLSLEKNGELDAALNSYQTFLKISEKKVDRKIRLQVEDRVARLKEK